jgi:DNA-binding protein WhiA
MHKRGSCSRKRWCCTTQSRETKRNFNEVNKRESLNIFLKHELSLIYDHPESEFYGFTVGNGRYLFSKGSVSISFSSTEIFIIRKLILLADRSNIKRNSDILSREGKLFFLEFRGSDKLLDINKIFSKISKTHKYEKKSFLRGVFLGCGILSSPPSYHLELRLESDKEMDFVGNILGMFKIKHLKSHNHIYIKGRENIKQFLHYIGGTQTYLVYEQDAVMKDISNLANRKANFEYANLERQTISATKQLKILRDVKERGLLNKMRIDLQEIAILRLMYPYLPLSELSKKSNGRYSKQSIYYRLKKIVKIYEK